MTTTNSTTIETMRHDLTLKFIAFKAANPGARARIDRLIGTLKRECRACETDEQEIVVLQRYWRIYCG